MSDLSGLTRDDLARMAKQHLESLKAAGLHWVPTAPVSEPPLVADDVPGSGGTCSSLFDNIEGTASQPGAAVVGATNEPRMLEQRRLELQVLAQTVSQCTRCPELVATRSQTVFGVGPAGVELCFVGEAPGVDEDAQGEPFVGAAGQLLNRIIAACRLKREEVYICNIIKCRPPGNRTPLPHEAANCRNYLEKQLELVGPRFICALGSVAAQNLLGTTQSLGKLRGRFHDFHGIPVLVTYHPAYLLPHRSPGKKKDVWQDMKMLLARMGRPVE